jgi:hypothetical protein
MNSSEGDDWRIFTIELAPDFEAIDRPAMIA